MTLIKISEDGLRGKAVNSFNKNILDTDRDDRLVETIINSKWQHFEANNPFYPLTEPGEPNCEVEGKLVWQYKFMNLDWLICTGLYNKEQCDHSGIPTRQAWQVSKPKVETPLNRNHGKRICRRDRFRFAY